MHDMTAAARQMRDAPLLPGLLDMALKARDLRIKMTMVFPRDIFVDKAWDMMIELVIAHATGERLCVKDLVILSGERPTSAMRRIDRLQESGLIGRHCDPHDHRRVQVYLTARGIGAMTTMLHHVHGERPDDGEAAGAPVTFRPTGMR